MRSAVTSLDSESRKAIFDRLSSCQVAEELIVPLVDEDDELYKRLLDNPELKNLHLLPLYRNPSDAWANKAIIAIEAGYSSTEVMYATRYSQSFGPSWSGKESDMWSEWIKLFEPYLSHPDNRIIEVADLSTRYAQDRRGQALENERREAIYGR